jgi:hypothetical protein
MVTLVSAIEVRLTDRRGSRKVFTQRASFAEVEDNTQRSIEIARGEEETFEFERCFFAHIRDVVVLEVTDENDNTVTYPQASGIIALPTKGKVKMSVPINSPIALNRVVHVVYS